jgi:hypothetical protein
MRKWTKEAVINDETRHRKYKVELRFYENLISIAQANQNSTDQDTDLVK